MKIGHSLDQIDRIVYSGAGTDPKIHRIINQETFSRIDEKRSSMLFSYGNQVNNDKNKSPNNLISSQPQHLSDDDTSGGNTVHEE